MARMLDLTPGKSSSILDPGAGAGALSESILEHVESPVRLTMVEQDAVLADHLGELLDHFKDKLERGSEVVTGDFIAASARWLKDGTKFTHVIMNPPYERVRSDSTVRANLKQAGVVASNLYAAFLWLGMDLLEEGGRMVAVVPRAVLSGSQFRSLRRHLLSSGSLFQLHHFRSRRQIFQRDSVQQEVVVLGLVKGTKLAQVHFSQSNGLDDIAIGGRLIPTWRFNDAGGDDVILVPSSHGPALNGGTESLLPAGVTVSVGNVVDFRLPEGALNNEATGVRLVGSEVFAMSTRPTRPPRWVRVDSTTSRFVMPPGRYIVIKRISPPETQPRLKHRVVNATGEGFRDGVTFENHVLVLHAGGAGLPEDTCTLLDELLGTNPVQRQIEERTGSTQINAADIRALRRLAARTEGEKHDG